MRLESLPHDGCLLHAFHPAVKLFDARLRGALLGNGLSQFRRADAHEVGDAGAVKRETKDEKEREDALRPVVPDPFLDRRISQVRVVFDLKFAIEAIDGPQVGGDAPFVARGDFRDRKEGLRDDVRGARRRPFHDGDHDVGIGP